MGRKRKHSHEEGTYLGDIPEIARRIANTADDDDALCRLHEILYGTSGVRSTRKLKIRKWNGISSEGKLIKLSVDLAVTSTLSILKEIAVLLGLEIKETRTEIEDTISNFLANPVGKISGLRRGRKFGSRNRSAAEIHKARTAPAEKTKHKKNAVDVPVKGNRGRPRKFNPVLAFTYFIKQRHPELVDEWSTMSESDQQRFWVKDRTQIKAFMGDLGETYEATDVESPS